MSRGPGRLIQNVTQFADAQFKQFSTRYGQQVIDILDFPIKLVLSPFTLAFDIAGSAPRGFGIPEFISKISYLSVFVSCFLLKFLWRLLRLELMTLHWIWGRKSYAKGQRIFEKPQDCKTCNGWQALRCTMCKGTGSVHYQIKDYNLRSGEKPTADCVADAIVENRAELVHLPSSINHSAPLPSKDCPTCDGTGVMSCTECKNKLQVRISADDIMEPPWKAYNVLKKMDYPYEHIVHSMKDPSIANFWLITLPQIVGGFDYDEDVKKKIWWQYEESMRYDQLRDLVAKRNPGWEYLQDALVSIDPVRAREDPVIVKNVPYYKAKKSLEAEVTKLSPPPRPQNWGELNLPLNTSSWSEEDLKNPAKLYEKTVLLNAQREIADKILDAQWEAKWRQEKVEEMLEEKVRPFIQNSSMAVLPQPILLKSQKKAQKGSRQRKWWFF
ncbi:uncharacterized protein LOC9302074 isoform X2 [Arabidopsis lyrata subsp. lyrata]|uniref:uncharacterized protein LOC9302074 isoform X2 n=1 Tax=Arabidopsis lyrata subsp. lyrata TaxID=81972 RepID=UPI000A29C94B|nr:uncharacterized protein LOC9302074 isoform X2 [Arabidopsis lyrata subsp. lyrata]|eukprot:XP_020884385.1 uncharacterized protein LOC9302074 isoform X2 [Arabidopsis lyrata subsp. lyrata]